MTTDTAPRWRWRWERFAKSSSPSTSSAVSLITGLQAADA